MVQKIETNPHVANAYRALWEKVATLVEDPPPPEVRFIQLEQIVEEHRREWASLSRLRGDDERPEGG